MQCWVKYFIKVFKIQIHILYEKSILNTNTFTNKHLNTNSFEKLFKILNTKDYYIKTCDANKRLFSNLFLFYKSNHYNIYYSQVSTQYSVFTVLNYF